MCGKKLGSLAVTKTDASTFERASATVPCNCYGLKFICEHCLNNHSQYQSEDGKKADPKKKSSVCHTPKKRNECAKTYTAWEVANKHICGYSECPSIPQSVQTSMLHPKPQRVSGSRTNEFTGPPPTIFAAWESEAMRAKEIHVPNLICARTSSIAPSIPSEERPA